jgi:hypothetical protein
MANKCQYWNEYEPTQCKYWDNASRSCTYVLQDVEDRLPSSYPKCNGIGTNTSCTKYSSSNPNKEYDPRCVLLDPSRHVCNRATGEKWKIENINCYGTGDNWGKCTGCDYSEGESITCSGYSPQHLGFGELKPTRDEDIDYDKFSTADEIGYRLPLGYEVYNLRAKFGRCYWWKAEAGEFSMSNGKVDTPEFKCEHPDRVVVEKYNKYGLKEGVIVPPCNGAKPECPYYRHHIAWTYCIDDKMESGDKVLADQILELRYYFKQESWTEASYIDSFIEPELLAWKGRESIHTEFTDDGFENNWVIEATNTKLDYTFEKFEVERVDKYLTTGNSTIDKRNYPSLVRPLNSARLAPIIKNKFDLLLYEYEVPNQDKDFVFEVTKVTHESVLIVGEVFYYNSAAYAINLSDPDLQFLPNELLIFDSMFDIEASFGDNEDAFNEFYRRLDYLLEYLIYYYPEKMRSSELPSGQNAFYIDTKTFFGDNTIIVFDKGSGSWEFDKISFIKILCNGVIAQTDFSMAEYAKGNVPYLPAYDEGVRAGTVNFEFLPYTNSFGKASVNYIYNDGVKAVSISSLYYKLYYKLYYRLYKITAYENLELDKEHIRFFGNSGYALLIIPDEDKLLSNAIKPFEIEGNIKLSFTTADDSAKIIDMEIVDRNENISRLELNQLIIKPKNLDSFVTPYDVTIIINKVYVYEKRSFGELPDAENYEEIQESFIGEECNVVYYDEGVKIEEIGNNKYEVSNFGLESMVISMVFKGVNGRIRGQVKTKIIAWVRQPYCRDVEIEYIWKANYMKSILTPTHICYQKTGSKYMGTGYRSYRPVCGDHDLPPISQKGPMWYPYTACDPYDRWHIVSNLTEFDLSIKDCFHDGTHGWWDMRMLGPDDHMCKTCDTHASIWDCRCDWTFMNSKKISENLFVGHGSYRGGVRGGALYDCLNNGGIMPKFGNVYRDFLRSYRSIDRIDYESISPTGGGIIYREMWMPAYEFFTKADLTSGEDDLYKSYCSGDYYDDGSSYINPFGLICIDGSIEDVNIEEYVDCYEGVPSRYRFEDVFKTHHTLSPVAYPYPKHPVIVNPLRLLTLIPWYTYKDCPYGYDSSLSIQWAWQEIWKDLERYVVQKEDFNLDDLPIGDGCCQEIDLNTDNFIAECPYHFAAYGGPSSLLVGRHPFLTIDHPSYEYDDYFIEHRLVCSEGRHTIRIIPPNFSEGEDKAINIFFWAQLDNGPPRAFDLDGNWDPEASKEVNPEGEQKQGNIYHSFYKKCTQSPWVTNVTLFESKPTESEAEYPNVAISEAIEDGRVITNFIEGEEINTYYQRGLSVDVLSCIDVDFPRTLESLYEYEVSFDKLPDSTDTGSGNEWLNCIPGEFYPAKKCFMIGSHDEILMTFKINSLEGAVCRMDVQFAFGAEKKLEKADDGEEKKILDLYHLPGVEVYYSFDGESYSTGYSCLEHTISSSEENCKNIVCTYTWDVPLSQVIDEMQKSKTKLIKEKKEGTDPTFDMYVKVSFKFSSVVYTHLPNYDEVSDKFFVKCVYLYSYNLVEAEEEIYTYERLYNISCGHHGTFPPHGKNSTGSLLYPSYSSLFQIDSPAGTVGIGYPGESTTMNKCRGRIMKEVHEDLEPLVSSDVHVWEAEQKKIHDEIAFRGNTSFSASSLIPPGFEEYLEKTGSSFPSWNISFRNNLIRPLAPVVPRESFSAKGHWCEWQYGSYRVCGPRIGYQHLYQVVYKSVEGAIDSIDVLVAYSQGTYNVLVHALDYLHKADTIFASLQNTINSVNKEEVIGVQELNISIPHIVDPIVW